MRAPGLDDDDVRRCRRQPEHQLSSLSSSSPPPLLPFLQRQQDQQLHQPGVSRGFNLLLLIPIIIGALLVLGLVLWLLVRWRRERKRHADLKRADSALLPIVDPAALLSPGSRGCDRQSPRGAALSFLSSASSTTPAAESQPSSRGGGSGSGRGGITSAQSTELYRLLHSDPNVSAHRLAFHKIAFERRLSSRASRVSSIEWSMKAACASPPGSRDAALRACETWLCQYEGEEIAVKVLARRPHSRDHASHFDDLQRLVDEIQLTASLEHANVVRFLGIAWDSTAIESLCMITEYLPAGDLQSLLCVSEGDSSARWSRHMLLTVTGVAKALQYLHARGVVHRGVRAKNVVLSRKDSEAKLVNIGATRHYPHHRHHDLQLLLDGYEHARFWVAPEVLSGRAECSERSDIYAFGALLAEIDANGQLPYEEDNRLDSNSEEEEKGSGAFTTSAASGTAAAWMESPPQPQPRRRTAPASATALSTDCPSCIVEIARLCLRDEPEQRVDAAALIQFLDSYASGGGGGEISELGRSSSAIVRDSTSSAVVAE